MRNKLFNYLETTETLTAVEAMKRIVDWLRPRRKETSDAVIARMDALQQWLREHPDHHAKLSSCLQDWLMGAGYFEVFTSLGVLARRGFSREFFTRLYERLNPLPADDNNIRDALGSIFHDPSDADWVVAIPTESWIDLLSILWNHDREQLKKVRRKVCHEVLYAIEMLSIWVAAEELNVEIQRLDPHVAKRDSAFVAQQRELSAFVRLYAQWLDDEIEFYEDDHARVLLSQCEEGLQKLRKRMVSRGSSLDLTLLLERLNQTLQRIELLLDTLTVRQREAFNEKAIVLFKQLVVASTQRHSLAGLWRQNSKLLARSVTENASHHGEHYVTSDRRDYLAMLASAAGGGFIIAFMALVKIHIIGQNHGPFTESLLSSLNYALGFVLIHIVGCTVATKQPAMTAAHFANAVEEERGRANPTKLAELLVRVSRSQFIAIAGNVALAMSVAYLVVLGYNHWLGQAPLDSDSADYLLYKLDITASPALFHAGIAGIWLFVSGLVSGYFDNRAARIELAARLGHHPWLRPFLPAAWRQRLAVYISDNYGALIGNFTFGCMLGMTGYVGYLVGLPLDIRHVAFSSADLGYASGVLALDSRQWLYYGACVLLIAAINLWVSFSLALWTALRSRGARISSLPKLATAVWRQVRSAPLSLLLPPRSQEEDDEEEKDESH
ncbi:MAG: site-specific recombinase [Porticoccaceae bacterium]|nr:site-specific recombinase [Porticoccaceae bacterium]